MSRHRHRHRHRHANFNVRNYTLFVSRVCVRVHCMEAFYALIYLALRIPTALRASMAEIEGHTIDTVIDGGE